MNFKLFRLSCSSSLGGDFDSVDLNELRLCHKILKTKSFYSANHVYEIEIYKKYAPPTLTHMYRVDLTRYLD